MSALRRGFKAEAERLALELRAEIGLGAEHRVEPAVLAELYGIPVVGVRDLPIDPDHLDHFAGERSGMWSATTVFRGTSRLIVLNDHHGSGRLANSLAHELAHVFLEHPATGILNSDGSRTWDRALEAEADELGAQILLPNSTAFELGLEAAEAEDVAARFGVSEELAEWRLNIAGGRIARRRRLAHR